MTEKRFKFGYVLGDTGLIDEQTEEWFIENCCSVSDAKKNWITVLDKLNEVAKENEDLKIQLQNTSDQRNEFGRGARENANRVGELEKENGQLKQEIRRLKGSMEEYEEQITGVFTGGGAMTQGDDDD